MIPVVTASAVAFVLLFFARCAQVEIARLRREKKVVEGRLTVAEKDLANYYSMLYQAREGFLVEVAYDDLNGLHVLTKDPADSILWVEEDDDDDDLAWRGNE